MPTADDILVAEARTFGRHLLGEDPEQGVIERYVAWHRSSSGAASDIETPLVRAARRGGFSLRMADAFACRSRPHGVLRRKLIVLLALAECSPRNGATLDRARSGGPVAAIVNMGLTAVAEVFVLLAAMLRFSLTAGRDA